MTMGGDQATQIAVSLAAPFEGCRLTPYLDPVGVCTIGYGEVYLPDGSRVTMDTPAITQDQAEQMLANRMADCVVDVDSVVITPLNPNQTAALADFVFNLGYGALRSSTLLKLLNSGDVAGAAGQFVRWDMAGGHALPGLLRRREAERDLFLKPWSSINV